MMTTAIVKNVMMRRHMVQHLVTSFMGALCKCHSAIKNVLIYTLLVCSISNAKVINLGIPSTPSHCKHIELVFSICGKAKSVD